MKRALTPIVLASAFALTGCTTYYSVSDPSTGKTYYTTKVKQKDGATHFEDAKTGKEINIQNSEVAKVTKDQYLSGMAGPSSKPSTSSTSSTPSTTSTPSTPSTDTATTP